MARLTDLGIDFDHWCFACGRANPQGLHLDFEVSRDRAQTRFVPRREHTGYDGTVHGGIVTALLDETMGWAIFHQGVWGVTARLSVTFRRPAQVGEALVVTGEVTRQTHRSVETRGELRDEAGDVLAEADALFLLMPEERRRELERRYARIDEALAKVKETVRAEERQAEQGRTGSTCRTTSERSPWSSSRRCGRPTSITR